MKHVASHSATLPKGLTPAYRIQNRGHTFLARPGIMKSGIDNPYIQFNRTSLDSGRCVTSACFLPKSKLDLGGI
jgi:hypothetical protein